MANDLERCLTPLPPDPRFAFDCRPGVSCFNACCRDLSQALTPYDVLRLARGLDLRTGEFLRRYALIGTGPGSGLPVVSLAPADPQQLTCPFLTPQGCRVYADRPSSCRTYPLVRLVRRSRDTGQLKEDFMLLREPHCRGFESGRSWTPAEWVESQGLAPFQAENDLLLELIAFKNRFHPGPLAPRAAAEAAAALYDADRLRERLDDPATAEVDPEPRTDDRALLRLGREQVKHMLAPRSGDTVRGRATPWT